MWRICDTTADELWEEPWLRCGGIFENKMETEHWDRSYDIEVVDIRGSWRDDLFLALWALQGPALSLRTRKLNQNSLRLIGLMGRTRA